MAEYSEIDFKKQHLDNYKQAVKEIVTNNTEALVNEDIMSLLKKPPLDSMDTIKTKFIALAKKEKEVLVVDELSKMMDNYRNNLVAGMLSIIEIRNNYLFDIIDNYAFEKDTDVIKINKKDLNIVNKKIKKYFKGLIIDSVDQFIYKKIDAIFKKDVDEKNKDVIVKGVSKFLKSTYQRDLLEGVDFKILVKDTILISGVKEQAERFIFTKTNSHLYDENI